jgi:hypothetical protein
MAGRWRSFGTARPKPGGSSGLPLGADRDADDPRLVDETGQVVEVDRAAQVHLVGDVAGERGDLVGAVLLGVAELQAALEVALRVELLGLVQEDVGVALLEPVGVGEQFAVADRIGCSGP